MKELQKTNFVKNQKKYESLQKEVDQLEKDLETANLKIINQDAEKKDLKDQQNILGVKL